jgi:hypothetical protein
MHDDGGGANDCSGSRHWGPNDTASGNSSRSQRHVKLLRLGGLGQPRAKR